MSGQMDAVVRQIRQLADGARAGSLTDQLMLQRFVENRDEAAFATLVRRHGPMILSLCRRMLHHFQDAEDVFQATFLVLARKAATIRKQESVGSWLYGVAYRLALKTKTQATKRGNRQISWNGINSVLPNSDPLSEITWREVCTALDEELARLPDRCRAPLVLFYLQGKTQDEALQQLGWSKSTFRRRLEEGRTKLCRRLTRRGITLSAGLWATLLSDQLRALTQPGSPTAALVQATVKAAIPFAAGETVAAVSPQAVLLAKEALKAAVIQKIKWTAIVGIATALTAGIGFAAYHAVTTQPTNDQPKQLIAFDERGTQPQPEKPKPRRLDLYGDPLPEGAVRRLVTLRFRRPNGWGKPELSPDGRTFISAVENAVLLCDSASGKVIRRFPTARVGAVAISRDGKLLALGDANEIRLWDITRDRQAGQLKVSEAYPFLFRPNGKALAVHKMKMNQQIALLDLATGRELWKLDGPDDKRVERKIVRFSADGKTLLIQEDRGQIFIFLEADTGRELRRQKGPGSGSEPVFSPDLKKFAAFHVADWSIRLWDAETGKELHQLPRVNQTSQQYTFSPDGKVLTWGRDERSGGGISLIDVATGKEIRRLAKDLEHPQFLAYWPNDKTLAFCTWQEKTIRFWDINHDREIGLSEGHRGHVSSVVYSPDGGSLISSGMDGMVRRWDLATGKEVRQFKAHLGGLWGMAVSPDGKILATASANDRIVRLWDAATGEEIRQLVGYLDGVVSLAFSPDGKILASGGSKNPKEDRLLRLWDVPTGKDIRLAVDPDPVPAEPDRVMEGILSVERVKFSPDGKLLAAACRNNIVIYEAATGRQYRQLVLPEKSKDMFAERKIDDLAFSPDGKSLVSGGTADADSQGSILGISKRQSPTIGQDHHWPCHMRGIVAGREILGGSDIE